MTSSTLAVLPGGTRREIVIPPFDDEGDTDLASIIPVQTLVIHPGPQWMLIHAALPKPIRVNPKAPLALGASEIASLGAGLDRYPPLIYALASALADLGLPIGEAEQITDGWADLTIEAQP